MIKNDFYIFTNKDIKMETSKYNEKIVKLYTIADGNCLIHAILAGGFRDYQTNSDEGHRRELAVYFRKAMADTVVTPDSNYPEEEDVSLLIQDYFKVTKPYNFLEFLRAMYCFESKEYKYTEGDNANDLKIEKLREDLEDKLGDKLYLPNKFNKGVIEAILEGKEIPQGKYSEFPFNSKIFTACKGANLIKLDYEYNKMEDVLYLRQVPRYFASRNFIGDADVMSYIPDLLEVNLVFVDIDNNKFISLYETSKSDRYIIIHNRENLHYETVGLRVEEGIQTIFSKDDEIIQEILKKEDYLNIYFV
jgi:hypothetical protein